MVKIKIDPGLYERAKRAAEAAGYSSVDEFVANEIIVECVTLIDFFQVEFIQIAGAGGVDVARHGSRRRSGR